MFDGLAAGLEKTFDKLKNRGKLTEENIIEALDEIRLSLIDADVNFKVAKDFIAKVQEKAVGKRVLKSLTPAQQIIQIVYEELTDLMGDKSEALNLTGKPPIVIMLVGLQGSGKTTTAAKLARMLKNKKRSPFLVPADVTRPAAIEQLKKLASDLRVDAFDTQPGMNPVEVATKAHEAARRLGLDTIILDTAGRLHVDDELMNELGEIKKAVNPIEILLVADAMTGQDAVNVVSSFHEKLTLTGCILTKLDGDARGGAALSIKATAGVPIKLVGMGEKTSDIEPFYPDRMASRILDKGDLLTFIEKAQASVDADEADKLNKKLKKKKFSISDFKSHLGQMKKIGSVEEIARMMPGMGKVARQVKDFSQAEKELKRLESIIDSMTSKERENHKLLNASRKRRIAKGSGTRVEDVNQLLKQFLAMQDMMRRLTKKGPKAFARSIASGKFR